MTNTSPEGSVEQIPIHFAERRGPYTYLDQFGIWSCRFSADGKEVVAGGSGNIFGVCDSFALEYEHLFILTSSI